MDRTFSLSQKTTPGATAATAAMAATAATAASAAPRRPRQPRRPCTAATATFSPLTLLCPSVPSSVPSSVPPQTVPDVFIFLTPKKCTVSNSVVILLHFAGCLKGYTETNVICKLSIALCASISYHRLFTTKVRQAFGMSIYFPCQSLV